MRRVIAELKPRWVVGENVPGILHIAAADVVSDLESLGFNVVVFDFEAAAVGALHRRERIAFVAHAGSRGSGRERHIQELRGVQSWQNRQRETDFTEQSGKVPAALACSEDRWKQRELSGWSETWRSCSGGWWSVEPDVGRMAYGIPKRVDRLKCLGNAVVPQQFYPIFKAIAEVEANA
jgi:DNA (cytosine-5)-methyltransferase 1